VRAREARRTCHVGNVHRLEVADVNQVLGAQEMARWWRKSHWGAVLREARPLAAAKSVASGARRRTLGRWRLPRHGDDARGPSSTSVRVPIPRPRRCATGVDGGAPPAGGMQGWRPR
jgi:hypothetical protein